MRKKPRLLNIDWCVDLTATTVTLNIAALKTDTSCSQVLNLPDRAGNTLTAPADITLNPPPTLHLTRPVAPVPPLQSLFQALTTLLAYKLRRVMYTNKQCGISLIELILFIVIIGIALAALLSVLNVTTQASVDPLLRKQALSICRIAIGRSAIT